MAMAESPSAARSRAESATFSLSDARWTAPIWIERFDDRLCRAYYAPRRGDGHEELDARLAELESALEAQPYLSGRDYGLADVGYVPWILRALERFGIELGPSLEDWLERVASRPAVAAERELVAAQ